MGETMGTEVDEMGEMGETIGTEIGKTGETINTDGRDNRHRWERQ
jgi:hypothetical protein